MAAPKVLLPPVTPRQMRVLVALRDYADEHGYPPSTRELGEILSLASSATPYNHLANLRDEGYVEWTAGKNRTYRLTEAGRAIVTR